MPSNKNPLAELGLGRKVLYTGWWGATIALWCLPHHDKNPLIVRTGLAIKEKQERIFNCVASIFKK